MAIQFSSLTPGHTFVWLWCVQFTWDKAKEQANRRQHGVGFETVPRCSPILVAFFWLTANTVRRKDGSGVSGTTATVS